MNSVNQRVLVALFTVLLVTGCGDSAQESMQTVPSPSPTSSETSDESGGTAPSQDSGSDTKSEDPPPDSTVPPPLSSLRNTVRFEDQDLDGIADSIDLDPQNPPSVDVFARQFVLEKTLTRFQEQTLTNTALVNFELEIYGRDLLGSGNDYHVILQTRHGLRSVPPKTVTAERWTVDIDKEVSAVHLVSSGVRSNTLRLRPAYTSEPIIYDQQAIAAPGERFTLRGHALNSIDSVFLSNERLVVHGQSADSIELGMPEAPMGSQLSLLTTAGNTLTTDISLRQTVSVSDDILRNGQSLMTFSRGSELAISRGERLLLDVRSDMPQSVYWDVQTSVDRDYAAYKTVIFPGESEHTVSLEAVLLAKLYYLNQQLFPVPPESWQALKQRLQDVLDSEALRTLVELAEQNLADGTDLFSQSQWTLFSQTAKAQLRHKQALAKTTAGPNGGYHSALARAAGVELGELQINVVEPSFVPSRNEYSGFKTGSHVSGLGALISCGSIGGLNQPAGLLPSDLCVENDTKVTASVAVYFQDFPSAGWKPGDDDKPVAPHITGVLDTGILGGTWGDLLNIASATYLTTSSGDALCGTRPCYVEIITGGLNITEQPATQAKQDVALALMLRTLIERVLVPIVSDLVGIPNVKPCVNEFIERTPGMLLTAYDFRQKYIQATDNEARVAAFNETFGKFVIDNLLQADSGLFKCLLGQKTAQGILDTVQGALGKAKRFNQYYQIAQVVDVLDTLLDFVGTPRTIGFNIIPRAFISSFSPSEIDTTNTTFFDGLSPRTVTIEGNRLFDRSSATTAGPDDYFPKLVLRDVDDNTQSLQLTTEDVFEAGQGVTGSRGSFRINVDRLVPLLEDLEQGTIWPSLALDHVRFEGYPGEALPLPSPKTFRYKGKPEISGASEANMIAGNALQLLGHRLDLYRINTQVTMQDGNSDPINIGVSDIGFSEDGNSVSVFVPPDTPQGTYTFTLSGLSQEPLTTSFSVGVLSSNIRAIVFSDSGASQDDEIALLLLDNRNLLREHNIPTTSGFYTNLVAWTDPVSGGTVSQVEIQCDDPGDDGVCTYSLKAFGVQLRKEGSSSVLTTVRGKIDKSTADVFQIVPI